MLAKVRAWMSFYHITKKNLALMASGWVVDGTKKHCAQRVPGQWHPVAPCESFSAVNASMI
jgi:hypothetical protein